MTLILSLLYTFESIFGTVKPVLCSPTVNPTETITKIKRCIIKMPISLKCSFASGFGTHYFDVYVYCS